MKKRIALLLGLTLSFTAISCSLPLSRAVAAETEPTNKVTMFRLYNPNSGEHFYTGNESEKTDLVKAGWSDEGIGWIAPEKSDTPVYRLYNANAGDHHYTMKAKEKDELITAGWKDEGTGWYSDDDKTVPLYREYNPNAVTGTHNYTTDKAEHDSLVSVGWKDEGVGWYAIGDGKNDPPKKPDDDSLEIGDIVILGTYEQDNDLTNGPEPIEWQYVADRDGHKLLLAKYALDGKPYNDIIGDMSQGWEITWEDCTLRKWLNEDFYDTAFSSADKKRIVVAHNENPDSYGWWREEDGVIWGAKGGNDTDDNVFLLSWTEAEKYFDGKITDTSDTNNLEKYFTINYNPALLCIPTTYARARGVETYGVQNYLPETEGCCYWRLRSPGDVPVSASTVYSWGSMGSEYANLTYIGVRPVILID